MTHLGYIVAAYAATAVVLLTMTAWSLRDLAAQKRRLAEKLAERFSMRE